MGHRPSRAIVTRRRLSTTDERGGPAARPHGPGQRSLSAPTTAAPPRLTLARWRPPTRGDDKRRTRDACPHDRPLRRRRSTPTTDPQRRHPATTARARARRFRLAAAATVAAIPLVVTSPADAAERVVHPGESIQAALDAARPGDTIRVAPGTYHESITIATDRVTLVGSGPDQTHIRPPAEANNPCAAEGFGVCIFGQFDENFNADPAGRRRPPQQPVGERVRRRGSDRRARGRRRLRPRRPRHHRRPRRRRRQRRVRVHQHPLQRRSLPRMTPPTTTASPASRSP